MSQQHFMPCRIVAFGMPTLQTADRPGITSHHQLIVPSNRSARRICLLPSTVDTPRPRCASAHGDIVRLFRVGCPKCDLGFGPSP